MALGKKKSDEEGADQALAEPEPAMAVLESDAPAEPAGDDAVGPAPVAEAVAPATGDDLLGMFSGSELEATDLSVIVDMAGEVDLDDLLEDLHTIASAMGITVAS